MTILEWLKNFFVTDAVYNGWGILQEPEAPKPEKAKNKLPKSETKATTSTLDKETSD